MNAIALAEFNRLEDSDPEPRPLTPHQQAKLIERERIALEEKLKKLTGVNVDISASVYNIPSDAKTRPLAHAALTLSGWRADRHGSSVWVESVPRSSWGGIGRTTIFVTPRKVVTP